MLALVLLIAGILGLFWVGADSVANGDIRLRGNGLIVFADAPGSQPGAQAWQDAHICTVDSHGKNRKQLTTDPGGLHLASLVARAPASSDNPVWSPDGTKLLFDTNRRATAEIWVIDADGSHEQVLIRDVRVIPARASWQPVRGSQ